jgi:hypothetical protein
MATEEIRNYEISFHTVRRYQAKEVQIQVLYPKCDSSFTSIYFY